MSLDKCVTHVLRLYQWVANPRFNSERKRVPVSPRSEGRLSACVRLSACRYAYEILF